MTIHKAVIFTMLLASASAAQAAPVTATASPRMQQERVSYSDVNISSKAGNAVMMDRIRAASRKVCGPRPSLSDAQQYVDFERCVANSVERASADLHSLQLRALNEKAEQGNPQR